MSRHVICHAHCPGGGRSTLLGLLLLAVIAVSVGAFVVHYEAAILGVLATVSLLIGLVAGALLAGALTSLAWTVWSERRDDARELAIRKELGLPPYDQRRPIVVPAPRRRAVEPTPEVLRVVATVVPDPRQDRALDRQPSRLRDGVQR